MSVFILSTPKQLVTSTRRARAMTVMAAVGAALLVWAIAEVVLGVDIRSPAFDASGHWDIGPAMVVMTSALGALGGWALLALLERLTSRAPRIWLAVASVALVFSFSGPLSGTGLDLGERGALLAMHAAVGGLIIPSFYLTALRRRTGLRAARADQ